MKCLYRSIAVLIVSTLAPAQGSAGPANAQDQLWTTLAPTITAAAGWTLRGIGLSPDGTLRLAPVRTAVMCTRADIDGGAASYDPTVGLCAGRDPYPAGRYDGRNYYNGGRFHYGTVLSPPLDVGPFDHAIVSWVAATPAGAWLEAHLRVRLATGAWTRWYDMPVWASRTGTMRRHSVDGQGGAATVQTDTLALRPDRTAASFQLDVTFFTSARIGPALRRLSLALSLSMPASVDPAPTPGPAWGLDLPVPPRSQMVARYRGSAYGGGGEAWCSPTSTAMILAYWAHRLGRADLAESVPDAARNTYDWTYAGTGNWPFNVAHATSFAGLDGYVARFPSLAALEPWIVAGVPLALAIAFTPGTLPGAPIPSSAGHLLVLRGFDRAGDPVVDDPAAPSDATVRRVYPRAALERAWLSGSDGTAYVIFPTGWPIPAP